MVLSRAGLRCVLAQSSQPSPCPLPEGEGDKTLYLPSPLLTKEGNRRHEMALLQKKKHRRWILD